MSCCPASITPSPPRTAWDRPSTGSLSASGARPHHRYASNAQGSEHELVGEEREDNDHDEDHEEEEEEDLGDLSGAAREAGEAERARDQRDQEADQRPFQQAHGRL